MNFSDLLKNRQSLLRQAHLANLAFSYATLRHFAERVSNARLQGRVRLRPADDEEGASPASLIALEGNQSVIEEHFSDEEIHLLADSIAFALETSFDEVEFHIEHLGEKFTSALRVELNEAGVTIDHHAMVENTAPEVIDDE
ncbi:hypothetical protein CMV30_17810 [Nibricoccus aquaticus]|uniref:Uncharacterized protein n=1 Tax=Nibricoccus aquaticus TaxID=2576891 RepID=A0A290QM58_9BACT|nr:hypothetical protein [Nibricoccus aquaticus]ATC65651.1 hypothetical protein CMV30_17810 [Nibricoccus aquaticus]